MSRLNVINGIIQNRSKVYQEDTSGPSEFAANNTGKFYKITVSNRTFNAAGSLGKKMTSGKNVAVVLKKTDAIMFKDLESGKIFGYLGPWVVLFSIVTLILFNFLFIPFYLSGSASDKLAILLSVNGLLLVLFLISLRFFVQERKAFKLLKLIK